MSSYWAATLACAALMLAGCETPAPSFQAVHNLAASKPVYPPQAERAGWEGSVTVDCAINETGTTRDCVIKTASDPVFAASGLEAAKRMTYSPALRDGIAVAVQHHMTTINYRLPARRFVLSALCDVQPSGQVRDCRVVSTPTPLPWPSIKSGLERIVATPRSASGQAVDDPARPVSIAIAIARLPLVQPMPRLAGDMFGSFVIACRPMADRTATTRQCTLAGGQATNNDPAGTTRDQVELGISGLVPLATGDFSQ